MMGIGCVELKNSPPPGRAVWLVDEWQGDGPGCNLAGDVWKIMQVSGGYENIGTAGVA